MSLGNVLPFIHFHLDTGVNCSGLVQHFLLKCEREIKKSDILFFALHIIYYVIIIMLHRCSPLFWRQRTPQLQRWMPSPAPPDLPALPAAAPNPVAANSSLTQENKMIRRKQQREMITVCLFIYTVTGNLQAAEGFNKCNSAKNTFSP